MFPQHWCYQAIRYSIGSFQANIALYFSSPEAPLFQNLVFPARLREVSMRGGVQTEASLLQLLAELRAAGQKGEFDTAWLLANETLMRNVNAAPPVEGPGPYERCLRQIIYEHFPEHVEGG